MGRMSLTDSAGSYIPLLLLPIPLSLSPIHFTILLSITYLLNRPCLYCSLLLIILFATSCHWSNTCLIDFSYVPISEGGSGYATWFLPRTETLNATGVSQRNATNETLRYLATAIADTAVAGLSETASRLRGDAATSVACSSYLFSAVSAIKDALRKEWVIPCINARIVL